MHKTSTKVLSYDEVLSRLPSTKHLLLGNGFSIAGGIAVDSTGDAYLTGSTQSTDFPVTPGAFQTVCGGGYGG